MDPEWNRKMKGLKSRGLGFGGEHHETMFGKIGKPEYIMKEYYSFVNGEKWGGS